MPVITQRRCLPFHWIHAAVLGALSVGAASADNGESTTVAAQSTQQSPRETLLQTVRAATERFKDVSVAEAEGYHLLFGCVTGPDSGAMGLHYVNMQLVQSGTVDATRPQIIIYEPAGNGGLKMTGADFLVLADPWDRAHPGAGAPQLMGQL